MNYRNSGITGYLHCNNLLFSYCRTGLLANNRLLAALGIFYST